jgi:hypothetical protein
MSKKYFISGYWKDDPNDKFENYIVKENHDVKEEDDESIFFYGMTEEIIKDAIKKGLNTTNDFVITSYKKFN